MSAPYELGITVGRFQTFHNGHRDIIRQALRICSRVGIFIGSADESLTFMIPGFIIAAIGFMICISPIAAFF